MTRENRTRKHTHRKRNTTREESTVRVQAGADAALSERNGGGSDPSPKGSRAAESQVVAAPRSRGCAHGIRARQRRPRVRGSERAGEMQAEEEAQEAIQEERYNFTRDPLSALFSSSFPFFNFFSIPVRARRSCAPLRGVGRSCSACAPIELRGGGLSSSRFKKAGKIERGVTTAVGFK